MTIDKHTTLGDVEGHLMRTVASPRLRIELFAGTWCASLWDSGYCVIADAFADTMVDAVALAVERYEKVQQARSAPQLVVVP